MSEQMKSFIGVLGLFMFILLLVFILALLTPKLAKLVDRLIDKLFRKSKDTDESIYKVRSIYDLPREENDNAENLNKDGEKSNGEE